MTMVKMTAANRKRLEGIRAKATHARILRAKRAGERAIPDKILRQLAALNLPPNPFVYEACLEKLMRGA